jgi:hypothetical protein
MKHLRRFNESILPYYLASKEVHEFCEMYLAYLLDDGFNISFQPGHNSKAKGGPVTYVTICFNKTQRHPVVTFSGDEIKDKFIPFVYMLNKEYSILEIVIFNKNEKDLNRYIEYKPTIEEILNGEIGFKEIVQINIKVKLDFKV